MRPLIVVAGPTASGKTQLALELAARVGGEIISADSMQVYRGMDIGTAKITPSESRGVRHHMIDVASPSEDFSAARWAQEAEACVEDIRSRALVPIIAGGTGLYIDALLSGSRFAQSGKGGEVRAALEAEWDSGGAEAMYRRLENADPARAERLSPNDRRRIVRALEIYALTGRQPSEFAPPSAGGGERFASVRFALTFSNREELYSRIERRVDGMLERGLVDEARRLMELGIAPERTAMQAIGYKELIGWMRGETDYAEAVRLIKQRSRRYAKRQLTWLRRDKGLHWLDRSTADFDTLLARAMSILDESKAAADDGF